ncbi:MAG: hypothetical protein HYZ28_07325 [Myxococcales bacterium]|nr:hypothetical protein [Myxococcales bacterium]
MAKGQPDPKLRPFRIAAYVTYLVVVVSFSTLIIVSVARSVSAMTPRSRPDPTKVLTARDCLERAERLWGELEQRRKELPSRPPASEADNAWAEFRVKWLERHREAEAMCSEGKDRAAARAVYRRLDKVMDLYTTHAVQYAGEVGPTADAFRDDLEAARKDVAGR